MNSILAIGFLVMLTILAQWLLFDNDDRSVREMETDEPPDLTFVPRRTNRRPPNYSRSA